MLTLRIAHLPSGSSPREGTMFPLSQLLRCFPTCGAARNTRPGDSLLSTKQVMLSALMWRGVKSGGGKAMILAGKRFIIIHRGVSLSALSN